MLIKVAESALFLGLVNLDDWPTQDEGAVIALSLESFLVDLVPPSEGLVHS
jgi:hypothetical protein